MSLNFDVIGDVKTGGEVARNRVQTRRNRVENSAKTMPKMTVNDAPEDDWMTTACGEAGAVLDEDGGRVELRAAQKELCSGRLGRRWP